MATIKSYAGIGTRPYSVKKREEELNAKLSELADSDPNFESSFVPAKNKEEFDKLYIKYMTENAEFTETKNEENQSSKEKEVIEVKQEEVKDESFYLDESLPSNNGYGLDELATKNVNTRDYVLDPGMSSDTNTQDADSMERRFDVEPNTWDEAFKIPEPDQNEIFINENDKNNGPGSSSSSNSSKSSGSQSSSGPRNTQKEAPFNPHSQDMSTSKQKRNAKRMATIAVDLVSKLSEMAFVYFCNKDITHERLIELQDQDLLDLGFIIEVESGNSMTIRDFFINQRLQAEELAKLPQEDKDDIIEALTEVILEKQIVLTPMQQLGVTCASIGVKQLLAGYTISSVNKMILEYSMNQHAGYKQSQPQAPMVENEVEFTGEEITDLEEVEK